MKKFLSSLKAMVVKVTAPVVGYVKELYLVIVDAANEVSGLIKDLVSQFTEYISSRREANSLINQIFATSAEIEDLLNSQ